MCSTALRSLSQSACKHGSDTPHSRGYAVDASQALAAFGKGSHLEGSQLAGSSAYEDLVAQYSQAVAAASVNALSQSSLARKVRNACPSTLNGIPVTGHAQLAITFCHELRGSPECAAYCSAAPGCSSSSYHEDLKRHGRHTLQVSSWRESIGEIMLQQDNRPAFNIQTTGAQLITAARGAKKRADGTLTFGQMVQCEHRYEVARCFSAFLQQVNNEAVELIKGGDDAEPFFVRVLS